MKGLMKKFRWVGINGAVLACIWFGGFGDVGWAANLAVFYAWLAFVFSVLVGVPFLLFLSFAPEGSLDLGESPSEPFPGWFRAVVTLAIGFGMAAAGWLWSAGAYLSASLVMKIVDRSWEECVRARGRSHEEA